MKQDPRMADVKYHLYVPLPPNYKDVDINAGLECLLKSVRATGATTSFGGTQAVGVEHCSFLHKDGFEVRHTAVFDYREGRIVGRLDTFV